MIRYFSRLRRYLLLVIVAGTIGYDLSPAQARASGTWPAAGDMDVARAFHTFTLRSNGQVLVAGGDGTAGQLASVELFHPATGKWTLTGNTALARMGPVAAVLPNSEVLVAGGSVDDDTAEAEL